MYEFPELVFNRLRASVGLVTNKSLSKMPVGVWLLTAEENPMADDTFERAKKPLEVQRTHDKGQGDVQVSEQGRLREERRVVDETARGEAEQLRRLAEEARVIHEQHREELEQIRQEREEARHAAEEAEVLLNRHEQQPRRRVMQSSTPCTPPLIHSVPTSNK
jgi:hypothetical protein